MLEWNDNFWKFFRFRFIGRKICILVGNFFFVVVVLVWDIKGRKLFFWLLCGGGYLFVFLIMFLFFNENIFFFRSLLFKELKLNFFMSFVRLKISVRLILFLRTLVVYVNVWDLGFFNCVFRKLDLICI